MVAVISKKLNAMQEHRTYKISYVFVLFKFRPCKLSHVFSCPLIGNVRCTPDNVPPQSQCALSLDELQIDELLPQQFESWMGKIYMVES